METSQTTFLSILLVVFLSILHKGEALQCVKGSSSTSFDQMECGGSCMNSTIIYDDRTEILRACSPVHVANRCDDFDVVVNTKTCYCNSDLCNTAFIPTAPLLQILLVPYLVHKFL